MAIQGLIIFSIVCIFLETMPEMAAYRTFFRIAELFVVAAFTIEYGAGWFLAKNRWRFVFHPMSMIDLFAIAPFYLGLDVDLRPIRALLLMRAVMILKLARYSRAMQMLGEAFRRSGPELAMTGFVAAIIVVISAMALYYAEHDAQPEVYTSMPAALWWAVVTLTTVGYGDVCPHTTLGRVIASIVMILGIGVIAVPTGILSGTFSELMRERREEEKRQKQSHSEPVQQPRPKFLWKRNSHAESHAESHISHE